MDRTRTQLFCGLIAVLVLAAGARADVIHLKSGGRVEGEIIEREDGRVRIRTAGRGIVTTIDESEIEWIDQRPTARQVYERMAGTLDPDDADGHFALGTWCRRHSLRSEMQELFRQAIEIDPDHEQARAELGYVRTEEGWMTRDEAMEARGLVQVDGEWMTEEEAAERAQAGKDREVLRRINHAVNRIRFGSQQESRRWSLWLSAFNDPEYAGTIMRLLGNRSETVRAAASSSLGLMRHQPAATRLVKLMLDDSSSTVRRAATDALRHLDTERVCDVMHDVIAGIKLAPIHDRSDQDFAKTLYHRLAVALGELGNIRSVPFLIEILYPNIEIQVPETPAGTSMAMGMNQLMGTPRMGDVKTRGAWFDTRPVQFDSDRYFFNQPAEDALRRLTGENLGVLPREWRAWWDEHGRARLREHEARMRARDDDAQRLLEEAERGAN